MPARNEKPGTAFALIAVMACSPIWAIIDGSHSEVSAERRLKDYLAQSQYPPTNQLLAPGYTELKSIPLVPGDQRQAGKILGFAGDQLTAGSLSVFFKVRIEREGSYSFRTFLLDKSASRGVQAMKNLYLRRGEHRLAFEFYGKAIRDSIGGGTFLLPGILAEKLPDDGADSGALEKYLQPFTTRAYRPSDFSKAPYDSAEKRAHIKALQEEIERAKK